MGEDDIAAENLQEQGAKRRTQNTATSYPPAGTNIHRGRLGLNSILPNPNEHASQDHVPRRYRAERPGPWTEHSMLVRLAPSSPRQREPEMVVGNTFHATGIPVWKSNVKLGDYGRT